MRWFNVFSGLYIYEHEYTDKNIVIVSPCLSSN
jgi:hypothetical protein